MLKNLKTCTMIICVGIINKAFEKIVTDTELASRVNILKR